MAFMLLDFYSCEMGQGRKKGLFFPWDLGVCMPTPHLAPSLFGRHKNEGAAATATTPMHFRKKKEKKGKIGLHCDTHNRAEFREKKTTRILSLHNIFFIIKSSSAVSQKGVVHLFVAFVGGKQQAA